MEGQVKERRKDMGIWFFVVIIAIWVLLQAYVLPKFGIST
jgi:hypothetical protein